LPETVDESSHPSPGWKLRLSGTLQGVGFRPTVARVATARKLTGWVRNDTAGVEIQLHCERAEVDAFLLALKAALPAAAAIREIEIAELAAVSKPANGFTIIESSEDSRQPRPVLPADMATCPDCLAELWDAKDRRYRYPFINCTQCGPRFSIVESLPYDRANTSMRDFPLSQPGMAEYTDPADRRYHAEPNCDPLSGPELSFCTSGVWDSRTMGDEAIEAAAAFLREGHILAVKGIGGYHLMCRADDDTVVAQLRERKQRVAKPLAVMMPSLQLIEDHCEVSLHEQGLLQSSAAPIVLLQKRVRPLLESVSALDTLGCFLPYSPLHHLLLAKVDLPLVATSGNRSEEPICIDNEEAHARLGAIADGFLEHNRRIIRPVDDSVVRVFCGKSAVLRRSRGYAPLPLPLPFTIPPSIALGADLKNCLALAEGNEAVLSQHIGDLENTAAQEVQRSTLDMLVQLFSGKPPQSTAHDLHPAFASTQLANELCGEKLPVQHHKAHFLSCLMQSGDLQTPALGIVWDGTGYGEDGTIWGGEAFMFRDQELSRCAHLRPFQLQGGDLAAQQPWRCALGLLASYSPDPTKWPQGPGSFYTKPEADMNLVLRAQQKGIRTHTTTSMGRLFDAIAGLIDPEAANCFEGEAAIQLEGMACRAKEPVNAYPFPLREAFQGALPQWDWEPLLYDLCRDLHRKRDPIEMAARFHKGLIEGIVSLAAAFNTQRVLLSGGCFQNKYLLEGTVGQLEEAGFSVDWPRSIPLNDGGIAYGQLLALHLNQTSPCV
jgi:hydrogenase maturation protein HypF